MAVNSAALALIKEFEGFVDRWYPDPAHGWKVPTCCYGHTDAAGSPFYKDTKDKRFSKDEGEAILIRDLRIYEAYVQDHVKVPLSENQYGALVSFTFNLGPGNLGKSTLLKKLNAGDYNGAAAEFGKWINAAGKPLPGLVRRREAERQLFLTPDPIHQPDDPGVPLPPPDKPQAKAPPNWGVIIAIVLSMVAFAAAFFILG